MKVVTIGRAGDNDIIINNPKVSRHHLQIELRDDGHYVLTDHNSLNGTKVNGKKVSGEVRLSNYDVVEIDDMVLPWQSYFKDTQTGGGEVTPPSKPRRWLTWLCVILGVLAFAAVLAVIYILADGRNPLDLFKKSPETDTTDYGLTIIDNNGITLDGNKTLVGGTVVFAKVTNNTNSSYVFTCDGAVKQDDGDGNPNTAKFRVNENVEKVVISYGPEGIANQDKRQKISFNVKQNVKPSHRLDKNVEKSAKEIEAKADLDLSHHNQFLLLNHRMTQKEHPNRQ